jgi:hypothetical protein
MTDTIIDKLYHDSETSLRYLEEQQEYTLVFSQQHHLPKILLLAVASYFEDAIKTILLNFFQEQTNDCLYNFVKNKAIERQYHTFFSWRDTNANQFFGLFGPGFKTFMKAEVRDNKNLDEAIRAFLEIGHIRNALVHENFATFVLDKTTNEVYQLYEQARYFIDSLPEYLHTYEQHGAQVS